MKSHDIWTEFGLYFILNKTNIKNFMETNIWYQEL